MNAKSVESTPQDQYIPGTLNVLCAEHQNDFTIRFFLLWQLKQIDKENPLKDLEWKVLGLCCQNLIDHLSIRFWTNNIRIFQMYGYEFNSEEEDGQYYLARFRGNVIDGELYHYPGKRIIDI